MLSTRARKNVKKIRQWVAKKKIITMKTNKRQYNLKHPLQGVVAYT